MIGCVPKRVSVWLHSVITYLTIAHDADLIGC